MNADSVYKKLRLDPRRKTAIIFPHIGYDASFGRGEDLFASYDEWLVETVRAACANTELQWVVRVHPDHAGKHAHPWGAPHEEDVLRRRLGRLPEHVYLHPGTQSDISTPSLFPAMDYCLTVRGTVGLEAACQGIPVITGGTGRYDRKGFICRFGNAPTVSRADRATSERLPACRRRRSSWRNVPHTASSSLLRPLPLVEHRVGL